MTPNMKLEFPGYATFVQNRSFESQLQQNLFFTGIVMKEGASLPPQTLFIPNSFLEGKPLSSSGQNAGEEPKLCCCNGDALQQCQCACLCLYVPSPPMPTGLFPRMLLPVTAKQSRFTCNATLHVSKFSSN